MDAHIGRVRYVISDTSKIPICRRHRCLGLRQRRPCVDGSYLKRIFLIRLVHLSEAIERKPFCAVLTAGPDGFCKPSLFKLCGQMHPELSTGYRGFIGRIIHHYLSGLANSLFPFSSSGARVVRFVAGQNGQSKPCSTSTRCPRLC